MARKILIAEDDADIVELLRLYLTNEGFEVLSAPNGEDALRILDETKIDLAVLDIMMPKMDGYELTKRIRAAGNLPVLILSARNMDSDKILGLDLGADDYMTKPFNPLELVARINSNLRRAYDLNDNVQRQQDTGGKMLEVGGLRLHTDTFVLTKDGAEVMLTPTEYKILALLMRSPGRVFTKAQIYENIKRGPYFEATTTHDWCTYQPARTKIEDDRKAGYIKTIRGLGYKVEQK